MILINLGIIKIDTKKIEAIVKKQSPLLKNIKLCF